MRRAGNAAEILHVPFKVESIAEVPAPPGSDGVWHRYVISQGANRITGMRNGDRADIVVQVDEMVERLNERRTGKHRSKSK